VTPVEDGAALLIAYDLSLERGGRQLFRNLSLEVRAGQLWQIEGENGAGKTSLLRILAGLSRYGFSGVVTRSEGVLYLGHQSAVKPLLTPRENLLLHPSGDNDFAVDRVDEALAQVGLFGFEDVSCQALSAGQQRRVNLARLFLTTQSLWILDEPFTAVDVRGVQILEQRIDEHVSGGGSALITSHQALSMKSPVQTLSLGSAAYGTAA
jgi:heme exporter protein A